MIGKAFGFGVTWQPEHTLLAALLFLDPTSGCSGMTIFSIAIEDIEETGVWIGQVGLALNRACQSAKARMSILLFI